MQEVDEEESYTLHHIYEATKKDKTEINVCPPLLDPDLDIKTAISLHLLWRKE